MFKPKFQLEILIYLVVVWAMLVGFHCKHGCNSRDSQSISKVFLGLEHMTACALVKFFCVRVMLHFKPQPILFRVPYTLKKYV